MPKREEQHDDMLSESIRRTPSLLILTVLLDRDLHGYGIRKSVESLTGGEIRLGEATIYPTLRQLESNGYISGRWETPEFGVPRKTYTITEEGKAELLRQQPLLRRVLSALQRFLGEASNEQSA
jgi:PadR family transcriptional regulator PadR